MIKNKFSILMILLLSISSYGQSVFSDGIELEAPNEVTDFGLELNRIPLMRSTDGLINNFIHSDSLVLQSQLKSSVHAGLERVKEDGKIGWRLVGQDPLKYGNTGLNAVDLSVAISNSNTFGATGPHSFNAGLNCIASNTSTVTFGYGNLTSGYRAMSTVSHNKSLGDYSFSTNKNNISTGDNSLSAGIYNNAKSYGETAIGTYGTDYLAASTTIFKNTDRVFNVGNGFNLSSKRDALTILKNGTITAPSLTNNLIDSAGDKALITKEYADYRYSNDKIPIASSKKAGLMQANFYEEGTYSPILNSGYTYTSSSGNYIRIGNLVTVNISVRGINGNSGELSISRPFNSISSHVIGNVFMFLNSDLTDIQLSKLKMINHIGFKFLQIAQDRIMQNISFVNGEITASMTYVTNVYTP